MRATELLMADHRLAEQLFDDLHTATSERGRGALVVEVVRLLSAHFAMEEAFLYAAVRARVRDGALLTDERVNEHRLLKQLLERIDKRIDDGDGHRDHGVDQDDLRSLEDAFRHHIQHEERDVFPALDATLDGDALDELALQLRRARATSPTHPHPRQPPATPVSSRISGAIDRTRDRLSGR